MRLYSPRGYTLIILTICGYIRRTQLYVSYPLYVFTTCGQMIPYVNILPKRPWSHSSNLLVSFMRGSCAVHARMHLDGLQSCEVGISSLGQAGWNRTQHLYCKYSPLLQNTVHTLDAGPHTGMIMLPRSHTSVCKT